MNKDKQHTTPSANLWERIKSFPVFDFDWWQEIWFTITHNKGRSVLTAFGVFWGMLILVLLVGSASAFQSGIMGQVEGFATNSCFIESSRTSEPYKGFRKGRWWNIVNEDIPVLKERIPEIQYIAPMLFGWGGDNNIVYKERAGSFSVKGNYPVYNFIEENKLIIGRYINDIDILEKRKVCVIGERIYKELFPSGSNPLGEYVRVNGVYFAVVGVAQGMAEISLGGRSDEVVILPFTTMQQAFNHGNRAHVLAVTAKPGIKVSYVEERIKEELRALHMISPTDKNAVWSMNMEEQFAMFTGLSLGITFLIWLVGGGILITGGVGISNIMLVTVRERTKEIGIRRALGATPRTIIVQIMSESLVLTILAGIVGLVLGVGGLRLLGMAFGGQEDGIFKDPQISFTVAIVALVILLAIGMLAGYLPARRAMRIKPIEAIREE